MKTQKEIFRIEEGDRWFDRNRKSSNSGKDTADDIISLIKLNELSPERVLEIGCSNGQRLELIRNAYQAECYGIDPSSKAIADGKNRYPKISLQVRTADVLPFDTGSFDMIIFGFCLYLCDRQDLFKIAYEADRCLKNEGSLIIKDFYPPFAYRNRYSHYDGVFSYKMDYSRMFTWNPAYAEISKIVFTHSGFTLRDVPDEKVAVIVLRKNEHHAYPTEPFHENTTA
ncbi:MAG: class I SAM-dependent methyltransferase [Desulfobacterales bacterium]